MTSESTTISTQEIRSIVDKLQMERNRDSTRKTYHTVWKLFSDFYLKLDQKPKEWEDRIVLFAGFLIQNKCKASTVNSYVSAIKSMLAEINVKISEDRFLLNSLVRACRLRSNHVTIRLPIQRPLLEVLLRQVDSNYLNPDGRNQQPYLAILFKALLAAAYYGLFRIGEITDGSHPIKARDVFIGDNKPKILFMLRTSKTLCEDSPPQSVKIVARQSRNQFCPYILLQKYMDVRLPCLSKQEPLFIFRDRSTVKPYAANKLLKQLLSDSGHDKNNYSFHSLRAGHAVQMLKLGVPIPTIQRIGRWKSNAVFNYLSRFN